jgi:carbamate kinase
VTFERGDIHQQFAHTRQSLAPIVAMARDGWRIAVVHGNGPQIGDELYRNEMARSKLPPLPLGVLVAATARSACWSRRPRAGSAT